HPSGQQRPAPARLIPTRVGTSSRVTIDHAISIGGLHPVLGALADAASLHLIVTVLVTFHLAGLALAPRLHRPRPPGSQSTPPSGRGCQKETLARQIRQSSRSARSTAVRRRAFSGFPPGDTGACGRGCGARAGRMTASDARGGSSLTLRRAQRALRRAVMAR